MNTKQKNNTISHTNQVAQSLAKKIIQRLRKSLYGAVVVALVGDLGAGKTTFVQGFAKALGIKEKITSPTFVILKRFKIQDLRFKNLIHIDAYRLSKTEELLELGWSNLVKNPQNIILIEWADKIKKILPKDTIWINFEHISEKERNIDIN